MIPGRSIPLVVLVAALGSPLAGANDEFRACVDELRGGAISAGIPKRVVDSALKGLEPDPGVLRAMERQPEFVTPVWDYLAALVNDERIAEGLLRLGEWDPVLTRAEERFGVDRYTLVALWGVETNYGKITGRRPIVRSLATVSCFGRRQAFFRGELLETLRILQNGDIPAELLKGSWAGAFGQTQFMPSTFHRVAIDFDGDGKRDIVRSVPDALASTANYLQIAGWRPGRPWGFEVRVPIGYEGPSGRRQKRSLTEWGKAGVRGLDDRPLSGDDRAALILPAGVRGPAFVVMRNFEALLAYNPAESYALAIAHLSDRLRGAPGLSAAWPIDDPVLSVSERRELQELLNARGFDAGEPDGIIGPRSLDAIRAFQQSAGLTADGYASARLLRALRGASSEGQTPAAPEGQN
jgi:lytic murein transglycosylase